MTNPRGPIHCPECTKIVILRIDAPGGAMIEMRCPGCGKSLCIEISYRPTVNVSTAMPVKSIATKV